jgi:hypothetical protein
MYYHGSEISIVNCVLIEADIDVSAIAKVHLMQDGLPSLLLAVARSVKALLLPSSFRHFWQAGRPHSKNCAISTILSSLISQVCIE